MTPRGRVVAAALFLALSAAPALAEGGESPAAGPGVSYVESSTGLSTPQWEGGMTELEFADLNGDGHLDLISLGDHGNPGIQSTEHGVLAWFGNGAGAWSHYQTGDFGYGGIAVGDLDGDGSVDIAYAMHHNYSATDFGDQLIETARGDGTGRNWTPWDDGLATNGEDYGMFGVDLADVDLDGDLDLASLSFGCCNGVHVYLNQGNGTWRQSFAQAGGNSTTNEIVFGDVNGDGIPDLAVGYEDGTVWLGDGLGGFTLADGNLPPAGGYLGRGGPDLADIDHDGKDDLSLVNSGGGVEVWLWAGSNTWTKAANGLPATGAFETTQMADMNGDGSMDLAACGSGTVTVWTGSGGGAWTHATTFNIGDPGGCSAFRVGGDADHNGRPDIALLEDEWINMFTTRNKLKFYKETSTVTSLGARAVYPLGGETFAQGAVRFLEWAAGVPAGQLARVKLEYSTTGAGGPWTLIADDLPNNGRHEWLVPTSVASENCYIRCTVSTPAPATATAVTPAAFTIAPVDSDGDGYANWRDCAPGDPGARAAPAEVTNVTVARDPSDPDNGVHATWDSQAEIAGPATAYDVVSGPIGDLGPDGVLELAICRAENATTTSTTIPLPVAAGAAQYILVRAQNSCGIATYGQTSFGVDRTATACLP